MNFFARIGSTKGLRILYVIILLVVSFGPILLNIIGWESAAIDWFGNTVLFPVLTALIYITGGLFMQVVMIDENVALLIASIIVYLVLVIICNLIQKLRIKLFPNAVVIDWIVPIFLVLLFVIPLLMIA